jgi:hypothetical protein
MKSASRGVHLTALRHRPGAALGGISNRDREPDCRMLSRHFETGCRGRDVERLTPSALEFSARNRDVGSCSRGCRGCIAQGQTNADTSPVTPAGAEDEAGRACEGLLRHTLRSLSDGRTWGA